MSAPPTKRFKSMDDEGKGISDSDIVLSDHVGFAFSPERDTVSKSPPTSPLKPQEPPTPAASEKSQHPEPPAEHLKSMDVAEKRISDSDVVLCDHVEFVPPPESDTQNKSTSTAISPLKPRNQPLQDADEKSQHTEPTPKIENQRDSLMPPPPPPAKIADGQKSVSSKLSAPSKPDLEPKPALECKIRPPISVGESAQQPRWLVEPIPLQYAGSIPVGDKVAHHRRGSYKLRWRFDAGPPSGWKGMKDVELYQYAYRYLESSMGFPFFREQIRVLIMNGPHRLTVPYNEDPLPDLPPPPATNHFNRPDYLQEIAAGALTQFPSQTGYSRPATSSISGDSSRTSDTDSTDDDDSDGSKASRDSGDLENGQEQSSEEDEQAAPNDNDSSNDNRQQVSGDADATSRRDAARSSSLQTSGTTKEAYQKKQREAQEKRQELADRRKKHLKNDEDLIQKLFKDGLLEKRLPQRNFRRMRRWAGESPEKLKDINATDLQKLPSLPTSHRAFSRLHQPSSDTKTDDDGQATKTTASTGSKGGKKKGRPTKKKPNAAPNNAAQPTQSDTNGMATRVTRSRAKQAGGNHG